MKKSVGIFKMALLPVVMLTIAAVLLLVERIGVQVNAVYNSVDYLPDEVVEARLENSELETECLMLYDSNDEYNVSYCNLLEYTLDTLCVGIRKVNVRTEAIPSFEDYNTVVLATPDFAALGDHLIPLFKWVDAGGRLFVAEPVEPTPITKSMFRQIGIAESSGVYTDINGLSVLTDFMIGAKGFQFNTGGSIAVINLRSEARVHVKSDTNIPVLWEEESGEGRIVVNMLGANGRSFRGYYAAAYSLLQDNFAYPVVNTSVFFLDDTPSPTPSGFNEYVTKYFKRDVASFYNDIWWPDMFDLAKRYAIKYSGVVIEDYTNYTDGSTERNTNNSRMISIGNQILNLGGELGYHGYNHQPLCYKGFNFLGKVDYKLWESAEASRISFGELEDFCDTLFPTNKFSVYVPPSNILSDEGRAMLVNNFPNIRTIAGVYQLQDYEYEQEFDVSEDGIINLPRIVSGTDITGFDRWTVICELNLHYVNTQFMHPDDALDEDRGAAKGWQAMYAELEEYINWVTNSAPGLRKQTASDASKAVQRYYALRVNRSYSDGIIRLKIDNFYDGAYFLVRIREGKPGMVTGGALTEITSELYLLTATSDTVEINLEG